MKKNLLSMSTLALALMLALSNCVKEDHPEPEPEPTAPDTELVKQINALEMASVQIQAPAPVQSTPSSIAATPQTTSFLEGLGSLSGGSIPSAVSAGASAITGALSPSEINTLLSVTPATLTAIKNGGAVPAELKAILDKAAANSALAAYLPAFTLPTVNGTPIGARTKDVEATSGKEEIEVTDECINAANAVYTAVKTKLDASRTTQLAGVASAYNAYINALPTQQQSCSAGLPAKYDALANASEGVFNQAIALVDANQATLGSLYTAVKAQVILIYLGYISTLNILESADGNACAAITQASTTNAQLIRDINIANVEAAYLAIIDAANVLRKALIQSCHNQGGGL